MRKNNSNIKTGKTSNKNKNKNNNKNKNKKNGKLSLFCYSVEEETYSWGNENKAVLGNTVYLNREDAVKAAEEEFGKYLKEHDYIGKVRFNDTIHRDSTKGKWIAATIKEYIEISIVRYSLKD